MTLYNYTTGIPDGPHNPSQDQPDMKQNNDNINLLLNEDHVSFNQNNGGYHKAIHLITQGSNPAISGFERVFSKNYTPDTAGGAPDTQLFAMTGLGGVSQLTGNSTSNPNDGWCWVGGILIQWGRKTGFGGSWPTTDQTLTFKNRVVGAIPFPNACFVVTTTFIGPTSSSTGDVCINSISSTNFHWQFTGSSSTSFDGFYWIAIGN